MEEGERDGEREWLSRGSGRVRVSVLRKAEGAKDGRMAINLV